MVLLSSFYILYFNNWVLLFHFFYLIGKQSVERTQSNQTVKEIRNKAEVFIPTYEW